MSGILNPDNQSGIGRIKGCPAKEKYENELEMDFQRLFFF